jgi:hypothetical protein
MKMKIHSCCTVGSEGCPSRAKAHEAVPRGSKAMKFMALVFRLLRWPLCHLSWCESHFGGPSTL